MIRFGLSLILFLYISKINCHEGDDSVEPGNSNSTCLEKEACPEDCPNGMVFSSCAPACLPTCDDPNPNCEMSCTPNCTCEADLIFDGLTRKCVPKITCFGRRMKCPENMVFRPCDKLCYGTCESPEHRCNVTEGCTTGACVCADEFLLDSTSNRCVKRQECQQECPLGMIFETCAPACLPTCDDPNPECSKPCSPNCMCDKEFLFDKAVGTCVPKEQCSKDQITCLLEGMVYRPCNQSCFGTCKEPMPRCVNIEGCVDGTCVCSEGLLLDEKSGKCVTIEQCPSICPSGMAFDLCAPGCPPTCNDPTPECDRPCTPNCMCEKNLLFDELTNSCVSKEHCFSQNMKCPSGMVFRPCNQLCYKICHLAERVCGTSTNCTSGGCVCAEELVFDPKSNSCLERDACPSMCPRGMVFNECAPACLPTCNDPNPECTRPCIANCTCDKDLLFDEVTGTCKQKEECAIHEIICTPEMEFRPCNQICYDTCDALETTCFTLPDCIHGTCVCRKGLVLEGTSGKCIKREECPLVCPNGMTFHSCAPACLPTCEDPYPNCDKPCSPACTCEENFLFNKVTGTCVPKTECNRHKDVCPYGMVFRPCNQTCYVACDDLQTKCVTLPDCIYGSCVCSEGLLLDEASGKCVSIKDCPNVCASGMVFDICGYSCFPTCEDPNPDCAEPCYPGCKCEKGFVYDDSKDSCVPRNACPKPILDCPSEMEPVPCDQVCFGTCEQPRMKCYYLHGCTVGACTCKKGLLLDVGTKTCVEKHHCPNICRNEMEFSFCAPACPPTCDNPYPECNKPCIPNCSCKKDLVLNEVTGECVAPESCRAVISRKLTTCLSDMEFRPCDKACHGTCGSPKPVCINPLFCFEGACVCKEGLLLDTASNTCVIKNACPKDCPSGMVYDSCATACPPTCDVPHPVCSESCYPNCTCKKNLILDKTTNTCVLERNCPRPTEAPIHVCPNGMEFRRCNEICYGTCSSPTKTCKIPRDCTEGACICSEELLLDTRLGKCVEKNECSRVCPVGMHFEECAPACSPTCDSPNPNCTEPCVPACTCDEGLLYDNITDKCIPKDNCIKPIPSCPDGMEFRSCSEVCYATCDFPIPHCVIPPKCTDGACVCAEGLVLHSPSDTCLKREDCNRKCPSGMVFESCAPACRPTCDDPNPICNQPCKPTCVCEKDTIFNKVTGSCIPVQDCTVARKTCPSEMEFHFCDNVCYGSCQSPTPKCIDPSNCTDGECVCKEGTLLDEVTGHCRKGEECVTCPNWSMKYRACGLACPPTCAKPGPWDDCNNKCTEGGCFCPKGLILDEQIDKCAPQQICTKKCPPEMEYHPCNGIICMKTCRNPSNFCYECREPEGRCVCKNDLVLDETTSRCVPLNKCRIDSFERLFHP